jgi:2-amino-4-hydroxy-6-hydroxymethyldihydropteridine diphosphokinase
LNESKYNSHQKIAYLGLGSNIDPQENIGKALAEIKEKFKVIKTSRFWESDPVGPPGPAFLNGVISICTFESFEDLKDILRGIEKGLGSSFKIKCPRQLASIS